jgi:hypothetical protein
MSNIRGCGDRVWESFCCVFFVGKNLNAKDIHKDVVSVYGGKCLSRKTVHNWAAKFRWWRRGWNGGAELAETTVKRILCCGFRRTGKATGQVYHWWRICRDECFFFQVSISRALRFIAICGQFTDSPSQEQMVYSGRILKINLYLIMKRLLHPLITHLGHSGTEK